MGNGLFPATPKYVSGVRGLEENNNSTPATFEFSSVDASAYTNVEFSIRLASFAGTSGNGADGTDDVIIFVSTDGGTTYSQELSINGNNNAKWGFSGVDAGTGLASVVYDGDNTPVNFTPAGGGFRTTDGYTFLSITNLPNSPNLKVKLELNNNVNNETWVVDDALIEGDLICTDDFDFVQVTSPIASPQNINVGDNFSVLAECFEAGVTEGPGMGPGVEAWIGYSSNNTDPSGTGWTWIPASYTMDSLDFDEYTAEIGSSLAGGTYYYASRWRLNGCNFNYAGTGGTWNNDSVELIVTDPCGAIFSEDFSTDLSQWGNTTDWTIASGELKHNLASGSGAGDSYTFANIGIQNLSTADYEWNFCMRNGSLDPSTNNNFSFVLLSENSNLFNNPTGYRVGVNQSGSSDFLELYRVNNGADTNILSSAFNWEPNDDVCIRVTRSNTGDWELFFNANGTGEISGGTVNDVVYTSGSFIGTFFEFSTTGAGLLWVDDISICSIPVDCLTTTIWDGSSWSSGNPTSTTNAILSANYSTNVVGQPSFECCNLTIDPGIILSITANEYVQAQSNVINNGRIAVQNNGSFVQVNNNATYNDTSSTFNTVTGNSAGFVSRETAFLDEWYYYTYWSSPVADETFGSALFQSSQYRRFSFNAGNFTDSFFENMNDNTMTAGAGMDDIDDDGNDWENRASADIMTPGVGYAATHSISAFIFGPNNYAYNFLGTLNNGTITVPVERNDTEMGDSNWNLIGNPYPSAIDAELFFNENNYSGNPVNGTLDGAIYLWSHSSPPSETANGNQAFNFSNNDYPTTTGNVRFTNAMRVTGNNNQFFRTTNNTIVNNKLWLNLSNDHGSSDTILIGYVPGATADNDGDGYDAKKNGAINHSMAIYSLIPNQSKKLGIQGKSPNDLDINEVISLGFLNAIDVPTIYTISIEQLQGDFLNNNTVFLKDNLTNTTHNLSASSYSFTSLVGEFNITIKSVKIFDALGKQIYSFKNKNSDKVIFNLSNISQSLYIAQIELSNGYIVNKKAIKK